jgi:hypothetical protein
VGERIRPGRVYVVFIPWDFLPLGFRGTCVIGAMGLWALKDGGSLESVESNNIYIYNLQSSALTMILFTI